MWPNPVENFIYGAVFAATNIESVLQLVSKFCFAIKLNTWKEFQKKND